MSNDEQTEASMGRRHLLRGGAVLAGAAGVTVIGAAMGPATAHAADGDSLTLGEDNAASSTTGLTLNGSAGGASATLSLTNANGPALALPPLPETWNGNLATGEVASTAMGPLVGVDYGTGAQTTFLATGIDLDAIPQTVPLPPVRLVDTRTVAGRTGILQSASGAFDSSGRLKSGKWLDVALGTGSDTFSLDGVYFNLTAVQATAGGYLQVYPAGDDRPTTSTVNFAAGQTIANGGLAASGLVNGVYAVRVYASKTSHVLFDVSGLLITGHVAEEDLQAAKVARRQAKAGLGRLRSTLAKALRR